MSVSWTLFLEESPWNSVPSFVLQLVFSREPMLIDAIYAGLFSHMLKLTQGLPEGPIIGRCCRFTAIYLKETPFQ